MDRSEDLQPKPGCSKDSLGSARHVNTDEEMSDDGNSVNCEVNSVSEPKPGCSKDSVGSVQHDTNEKMSNYVVISAKEFYGSSDYEGVILDTSQCEHYTIANDVIIEHIQLEEGECAETTSEKCEYDSQSSSRKHRIMRHWTDSEKELFLRGLQTYGADNISQIAAMIPTKTLDEVTAGANYYQEQAELRLGISAKHLATPRNKLPKRKGNPLAEWTCMLNESYSVEDLETVTADAVRLIANCEHFAPPTDCLRVDFRKALHFIADAMEGRPLREINSETKQVLRRALTEVSVSINSKVWMSEYEIFVRKISSLRSQLLPKSETFECPLKTLLANLASVKNYNPFNVPLQLLKHPRPENYNDLIFK